MGCGRGKILPLVLPPLHAQLWFDGLGEVAGFVLSEDGENIFFIFTRPGYDDLYTAILDWTIENWGSRWPSLVASRD